MDEISLRQEILKGEDSRRQFTREVTDATRLAAEVAAFLNTSGGQILVGVDDDGTIFGLTPLQLESLNQLVSNVSTQHIQPPVSILTEIVPTAEGTVMIIGVENVSSTKRAWPSSGDGTHGYKAATPSTLPKLRYQRLFSRNFSPMPWCIETTLFTIPISC